MMGKRITRQEAIEIARATLKEAEDQRAEAIRAEAAFYRDDLTEECGLLHSAIADALLVLTSCLDLDSQCPEVKNAVQKLIKVKRDLGCCPPSFFRSNFEESCWQEKI